MFVVGYDLGVTAQGSAITRFRRALASENAAIVWTAMLELEGRIDLDEALEVVRVFAVAGHPQFDAVAARLASRIATERRLSVAESRKVLALVEALPEAPALIDALRHYCPR
jgi:hypothetical protein